MFKSIALAVGGIEKGHELPKGSSGAVGKLLGTREKQCWQLKAFGSTSSLASPSS